MGGGGGDVMFEVKGVMVYVASLVFRGVAVLQCLVRILSLEMKDLKWVAAHLLRFQIQR